MREGQQLALFCQLLRRLAAATLAAREAPRAGSDGRGAGGGVVVAEVIELAMAAARRAARAAEDGGRPARAESADSEPDPFAARI